MKILEVGILEKVDDINHEDKKYSNIKFLEENNLNLNLQ